MILLVGIGNVGNEYKDTRHNIGFMAIDEIESRYASINPSGLAKTKYNAEYNIFEIEDKKILTIKPHTYVNRSGIAVKEFKNFYKTPIENIFVIHDDLDLKIGQVRIKTGGGHAGHNGLKSLDSHIGKNYHRIRIGISHPRDLEGEKSNMNVSDYVLSKFTHDEQNIVDRVVGDIVNNIVGIIDGSYKV